MKIALIHHQLSRGGGMETYFVDLITELVRRQYDIEILTAKVSSDFNLPAQIKTHVFPSNIFPRFLRKYYFSWQVKRYCQAHHFDLTLSTTRSFSHDMIIVGGTHKGYLQANRRFRLSDRLECFLENKAYHSARLILAHSMQIRQDLINLYQISPAKIIMLYPPVDMSRFYYKAHAPHSPFRILFVSTSHRRKGGFLLLAALKQLPAEAFELWIAGKPFPAARKLKQSVKFLGYVDDMAPVYHAADLMVLPSYFEPFGLVVAQALECGTPVLVSKRSGISSLLATDESIILENQTVEALKTALLAAKTKSFKIDPGFVNRKSLGLIQHVDQLLHAATKFSLEKEEQLE